MDSLSSSCDRASDYPKNLVCTQYYYRHVLEAYRRRLDERHESMLCDDDEDTELEFWQCDFRGQDFWEKSARSLKDTKEHLNPSQGRRRYGSLSQFMFIHAPNSRARLNISLDVLQYILSYHQVTPAFLDFLFSFGEQDYAKDFHYMGVRCESHLENSRLGMEVPELNRSGRSIQICYSLRGVEPTKTAQKNAIPWSIRQTAIFQAFDFRSNQATWIVVKGGKEMKERIVSATSSNAPQNCRTLGSSSEGFASCLATHEIIADWASQDWRWYINALEESVQDASRKSLHGSVFGPYGRNTPKRSSTMSSTKTQPGRSLRTFFKVPRRTQSSISELRPAEDPTATQATLVASMLPPPPPRADDFSFSNIRQVEFLQEKVNEALLVLQSNMTVLKGLQRHFEAAINSTECPDSVALSGADALKHFDSRIACIESELTIQQTRLHTLRQLLTDRKDLLHGDLQYRITQASYHLTDDAQKSASRMEAMTKEMHEIAEKTKKETVVMRIITVVALVFLPGTFISTLMSTDIVSFSSSNENGDSGTGREKFSEAAFSFYLEITVPLMLITFLLAYGAFKWLNGREEKRKREKETLEDSPEEKV